MFIYSISHLEPELIAHNLGKSLSEFFLHFTILTENNNLIVNGYKIVKVDHLNNLKKGSVCAYMRESLPVRYFNNSYQSKCLTLEVTISNKNSYIIILYRPPIQMTLLENSLIGITSCNLHFGILLVHLRLNQ